jgi:hypothetical protein
MPDFALFFTASEETILDRLLDTSAIQAEYDRLVAKRRAEKAEAKERERQEKIEAGEELPDEEEEEEENEEDDPEMPNLQEMIAEEKTKLTTRRETDLQFIEELKEAFELKNIKTALIDTSGPKNKVFINVVYEVKPYIENRENFLE